MSIKLGIIADDLSGGMNIGVEFSSSGLRTTLMQQLQVSAIDTDVLIFDTATRIAAPEMAVRSVQEAAAILKAYDPLMVVKKIDSLLRGAVGYELEAVQKVFGFQKCLLVAASPKLGRTTVAGNQLVDGQLLEQVRQRVDPSSTTEGSYIPSILAAQTQLPVDVLKLEELEADTEAVVSRIRQSTASVLVADCQEQAGLNHVVRAAYSAGVRYYAGTYGLGEALALLLRPVLPPVLLVVGSLSAAAYEQVAYLKRALRCPHIQVRYDESFLNADVEAYARDYQASLQAALEDAPFVILQVSGALPEVELLWRTADRLGMERSTISARVDAMLQAIVKPLLPEIGAVVATGGSTAHSIFSLTQADALQLATHEILPGTPAARLMGGAYTGMPFVAKPGSQGDRDALVRLAQHVREMLSAP